MRLVDKVAVISGAGSGIGLATAKRFAHEGAQVFGLDRTLPSIDIPGISWSMMDVTEIDSWTSVVSHIYEKMGQIDILFNNAGTVGSYSSITEVTLEDWTKIVDVNLNGVFYGMRSVLPYMQRTGAGSIINTSSIWGLVGADGVAAYQASKGAVTVMSRNAAMTYARDGIRVNSLHPGLITTPMTINQNRSVTESLLRGIPLGRPGTADEVANAVLFLASDESSYVTGMQMIVDGGFTTS